MISCDQARNICDRAQYKEASLKDKIKLNLHLMWCKTCSLYTKKNQALTSLCERAGLTSLRESEKEEMKSHMKGGF